MEHLEIWKVYLLSLFFFFQTKRIRVTPRVRRLRCSHAGTNRSVIDSSPIINFGRRECSGNSHSSFPFPSQKRSAKKCVQRHSVPDIDAWNPFFLRRFLFGIILWRFDVEKKKRKKRDKRKTIRDFEWSRSERITNLSKEEKKEGYETLCWSFDDQFSTTNLIDLKRNEARFTLNITLNIWIANNDRNIRTKERNRARISTKSKIIVLYNNVITRCRHVVQALDTRQFPLAER